MMNDSFNEYHLTRQFEYRRDQLMEEARRERLKAEVLRRAHQQSQSPIGLHEAVAGGIAGLRTVFRRLPGIGTVEQPCVLDDCLESSPT